MICGSVVLGFVLSKSESNNPWSVLDVVMLVFQPIQKQEGQRNINITISYKGNIVIGILTMFLFGRKPI